MDLLLESGLTDQRIPFYAPSSGLANMKAWVQRGGNTAILMTTPTFTQDSLVPELWRLLLDEQTTITAGKTTESLGVLITADGMTPLLLRVVLYKNLKVDIRDVLTSGTLQSGGADPANPIGF